jgi:hypothetical protein
MSFVAALSMAVPRRHSSQGPSRYDVLSTVLHFWLKMRHVLSTDTVLIGTLWSCTMARTLG